MLIFKAHSVGESALHPSIYQSDTVFLKIARMWYTKGVKGFLISYLPIYLSKKVV